MNPDFSRLFESAPGCMLALAPDFTIVAATDSYLRATMRRREDIIGRNAREVFPENPEDPGSRAVENMGASLRRVVALKERDAMPVQKYDIQRPAEKGGGFEERYWAFVNTPVLGDQGELDYILHSAEDVTAVVRLERQGFEKEKALHELALLSEERYAKLLEAAPDAMVMVDPKGVITLANRQAEVLFGYPRVELIGRSVEILVPDASRELHARALEDFFAQPTSHERAQCLERTARRADGSTLSVEIALSPLQLGEQRSVVAAVRDVSARKRMEAELLRARAAADAASAAKSEFLSSMSHELRTPMNAILGFAQVLQRDKRDPLSQKQRDRVGQILRGGAHLLRLIEDILDLSRIESGRVSVACEVIGIQQVLDEVGTTLEAMAEDAGVRVEVHAVPAGAREIVADRTRFSQILMNYGSNAIKYNRAGGAVTLRVSAPEAGRVRVTVADTGVGIPDKEQEGLFQPFHRAGQENGPIEGTGIGLAITKRLAALMKGTTGFRSVPGEGSEFWVELPAPETNGYDAARGDGRAESDTEMRRGLVLYIEDSSTNVLFMQDLLSSFEGVELVTAKSAERGLEIARTRGPDVILMDLHLPGMNGVEALDALKKWPETRAIPVIALTAAASSQDREMGEAVGFFRYLTKPVNVAELEGTLASLLPS